MDNYKDVFVAATRYVDMRLARVIAYVDGRLLKDKQARMNRVPRSRPGVDGRRNKSKVGSP